MIDAREFLEFQCSSASRKFLNDGSQQGSSHQSSVSVLFSEPKIPQCRDLRRFWMRERGFSALQRAENSSIALRYGQNQHDDFGFQCSSASRKFLNSGMANRARRGAEGFQCSSASRKFLNWGSSWRICRWRSVSVLFSEPKIPQLDGLQALFLCQRSFSALQRAENSSMRLWFAALLNETGFSALQRAENSSIVATSIPSAT